MKINVNKVERELINGKSVPVAVHLVQDDFFSDGFKEFNYKVTNEGSLYYQNHRLTEVKKFSVKRKDTFTGKTRKTDYGYEPIKFVVDDLPFLEEIVKHWENIRNDFVHTISSGQSMIGHISTKYIFPDGTEKIWYSDRFRKDHKESLKKHLEYVKGKPYDKRFPSKFCTYLEDVPYEHHYKHGRLNYFLRNDSLSIEDEETIQQIENPEEIIELLKFISAEPKTAVERLVGKGDE
ncbi:hypothetical protein HZA97_00525 [Candidatus Woesearchaeota archaeon]|nr:hypothetical protein [Candidatus Woesearchaeota archaeon]